MELRVKYQIRGLSAEFSIGMKITHECRELHSKHRAFCNEETQISSRHRKKAHHHRNQESKFSDKNEGNFQLPR